MSVELAEANTSKQVSGQDTPAPVEEELPRAPRAPRVRGGTAEVVPEEAPAEGAEIAEEPPEKAPSLTWKLPEGHLKLCWWRAFEVFQATVDGQSFPLANGS